MRGVGICHCYKALFMIWNKWGGEWSREAFHIRKHARKISVVIVTTKCNLHQCLWPITSFTTFIGPSLRLNANDGDNCHDILDFSIFKNIGLQIFQSLL
ncbi:hypothetical protein V6N11_055448 [Hibiscus sabdariffa]|uniref:Uncharacterized protein n=1 Tax=Hibiscus sabdariffa TaxID=183260 RepID=A0ABR2PG10_9ROSI